MTFIAFKSCYPKGRSHHIRPECICAVVSTSINGVYKENECMVYLTSGATLMIGQTAEEVLALLANSTQAQSSVLVSLPADDVFALSR